jgi:cobalt-zinc-cadmium efflux system protein
MNGFKTNHKPDSSSELFEYRNVARKKLSISLIITLAVMLVELAGGILTGSISLLSDAGHMFTHSFAITISLVAAVITKKPSCHHRTFGLFRAEVLAAFINGIFLLLVVGVIAYEAIRRIINPVSIDAFQMLTVALIGLSVNVASILILRSGYRANLNIRSVFYHLLADAASSVGIVIGAVIIFYTGWNILDPLISLGISALILVWSITILRESSNILLEMAPRGLNVDIIEKDLRQKFHQITRMDKVHLWSITTDMLIFSAHIAMEDINGEDCCKTLFREINKYLEDKYGIMETTIQHMKE